MILEKSTLIIIALCSIFCIDAKGGIPEKLADFNLNSKRESEKIGASFQNATETTGILNNGIYISKGGFIRIPCYPSFRAEAMTPELNIDTERGTLEFRVSPIDNLNNKSQESVLFACESIGKNHPGLKLAYKKGSFLFEARDEDGKELQAISKNINLKAGEFYHIAISWNIRNPEEESVLKIYFNGKEIADKEGRIDSMGTAPPDFFLASNNGKKTLSGTYDEIKIWNIELNRFDIKEDKKEDRIKNAKPIKVENFNDYPNAVDDKFLGKCFPLPGNCVINEVLRPDEGMLEFWIKPTAVPKGKSEICRTGNDFIVGTRDGKLFLKCQGNEFKTKAAMKMNKWNALSLLWNINKKHAWLYLNGKEIAKINFDKKISTDLRLSFSMKDGKALLKGVKIWHIYMPQKNAFDKGFRLTGNYPKEYQNLLNYDIPIIWHGDYSYSKPVDGMHDIADKKGPFLFSSGKLTDGEISVGAKGRVSHYESIETLFDMKSDCYISEILVYCASRPNWHLKDIEFFCSSDGKKWIDLGKLTDNNPEYTTQTIVPFGIKVGKTARFIKLKTSSKEGHLSSIAEVLIFGKPTNKKKGK